MVTIRSIQITLLSILLVGGIMSIIFSVDVQKADSGAAENLSGFAWSDTIGWISMNSTSDGSSVSYGVNVDGATGNLSGYAWSDNIGWVSFQETTGCPQGTCRPNFDKNTREITGWARALSAPNAGINSGGWDGWISLNCANTGTCATSDYKVSVTGCSWSGYAWGSTVVGWVSFSGTAANGSTYGVTGSGAACVGQCTPIGNPPTSPGASVCSANYPILNTPYSVVATCGGSATKCMYKCNAGYLPNSTGTDCRPTQCNDDGDNDSDLAIDYDGNGTPANKDLGCFDTPGNPIDDDMEDMVVGNPTLKARPSMVSSGGSSVIDWFTGGVEESTCTFTANVNNNISAVFTADDGATDNPLRGSYTTPALTVRTTYTIVCGARTASVVVEVQGYGQES